ncbi:uncharacterized protein [Typha angustifolia]|uniref:uncharacterized protein n=1 Tax=Typha angustifolia TaxID=59011 RepID=UPI003C3017A1
MAATAVESFSIREYAAQMRSVDFGKCWPFDGDAGVGSLPPMPYRRFRWWSDELAAARSGGGEVDLAAPSTPEEKGRQGRGKQRTPKKRSIVELFAVSPQITAVEDESGDGEEERAGTEEEGKLEKEAREEGERGRGDVLEAVEGGSGSDGKRKERIKEDEKVEKMRKMKLKSKKAKKQQRLQIKICVEKKEKTHNPKISSLNISQLFQDAVNKKMFRKSLKVSVHTRKKKSAAAKNLLEKQNLKVKPRLLTKSQKSVKRDFPIHSILKKQTKTSCMKKDNFTGDREVGCPLKPHGKAKKHVTFSGKDDILGNSKNSTRLEVPQLQSLCKMLSDVLAASTARSLIRESDRPPSDSEESQVVNESRIASGPMEKNDRSLAENLQLTPELIVPLDKEKTSLDGSVDLNHVAENSNNLNCFDSGSSACSSSHMFSDNMAALNIFPEEGPKYGIGTHAEENFPISNGRAGMSIPISSSCETSSQSLTRNLISQPSSSCLVSSSKENVKDPLLEAKMKNQVPDLQPRCHLSSKDVMSSISSSTGSNKSVDTRLTTDCMSACRNFCFNEDYIGLPLNSHGELIKKHSCHPFGPTELFKRQDMVKGSSASFPVPRLVNPQSSMDHANTRSRHPAAPLYWKEKFRWYPECYYSPVMPVTSGLSFMHLPGFERMEIHNYEPAREEDQTVQQGRYSMKLSCPGCRVHNHHSQNLFHMEKFQVDGNLDQEIQPAAQPTMRLMGQTVTLGKNTQECRSLDDGKIWTDKDIISEECHTVRNFDQFLPYQLPQMELITHPASELSNGCKIKPLEVPSSLYGNPSTELRFDHMHLSNQPQRPSGCVISSSFGNHSSTVNSHSQHPQAMLNRASVGNLNSVTRYSDIGCQVPFVVTHHQNVSQHMLLNSTHCKHTQSLSFSTSSTSNLHKNYCNIVEPPSVRSSPCLPHWLINAKQQKKAQLSSFSSYPNPIDVHHPCAVSGSKLPSFPSTYPSPVISFPVYNSNNVAPPCGSTSLFHPSFIPAYPPSKSASAVSASCKNKSRNRNEMKSKYTFLKGLDCANRSKKRPAVKGDEFLRPVKKPHLTMQNDLTMPTEPSRREELPGCTSDDTGTTEMSAFNNKMGEVDLQSVNNEDSESRTLPTGSRLTSGTRPGPVKLSAGAKHVLKPSPNMDEDNSRPIHSTIPLAFGTSCGKMTLSQKENAKIYRF